MPGAENCTQFRVAPSTLGDAELTVPGDKSVSHRALILGALANGRTTMTGFLPGGDCLATLQAFRDMGVAVTQHSATDLTVDGVGLDGLSAPNRPLDLGNSGTAMRLLAGVMAGQPFASTLSGDTSLSQRPMQRIITPLKQMGATITSDHGTPPLTINGGGELRAIDYAMPVASAQVKSAVLLAGLYAEGTSSVVEPAVTRDHTERLLRTMGAKVGNADGKISIIGRPALAGQDIQVPADLSSASFILLAAILAKRADILLRSVGVNPTRTGVIDILKAMGAEITLENTRLFGEEPVADIRVRASQLSAVDIDAALVSRAIDEFPALFVAAAAARGKTRFSGIGELRVKESDRIAAMASALRALGITVTDSADSATVEGGQFLGGVVDSRGDHRVAMALAVAGTVARDVVTVNDVAAVDTSFPGFVDLLRNIGADIAVAAGQGE